MTCFFWCPASGIECERTDCVGAVCLNLYSPIQPAPVVAIPNVPATRVVHFGGAGRYHLPAVGFIVRSRQQDVRLEPEDWT